VPVAACVKRCQGRNTGSNLGDQEQTGTAVDRAINKESALICDSPNRDDRVILIPDICLQFLVGSSVRKSSTK
jgi:hypothetical protein